MTRIVLAAVIVLHGAAAAQACTATDDLWEWLCECSRDKSSGKSGSNGTLTIKGGGKGVSTASGTEKED